MSIYSKRRDIDSCPPPRIVFYGHSFIKRLVDWEKNFTDDYCPMSWDHTILDVAKFVFSSGSTWKNVHSRVQGIDVPRSQTQGNTWKLLLEDMDKGYCPTHLFANCGSNDVDSSNDLFHFLMCCSQFVPFKPPKGCGPSSRYHTNYGHLTKHFVLFDPDAFVEVKYNEIIQHIDRVFEIFHTVFDSVEYHAMGIPIRGNWYPHMVALAEKLNRYLERKHEVNVIRINYILKPEHFVSDKIHLNCYGYRLYMDYCVSQTITTYYKVNRKSKAKRLADLSKSARKSLNKKLKLCNKTNK